MGNDAGRGLSRRGAGRAPPFVRRGAVSARELGRPPWPCAPQLSPCPLGGLETEGGLAFLSARQTVKRAPEGGRWLEAARTASASARPPGASGNAAASSWSPAHVAKPSRFLRTSGDSSDSRQQKTAGFNEGFGVMHGTGKLLCSQRQRSASQTKSSR